MTRLLFTTLYIILGLLAGHAMSVGQNLIAFGVMTCILITFWIDIFDNDYW